MTGESEQTEAAVATAVIPTFDRRDLVCDAIDSVLAQTVSGVHVIVVDDGSTDGTAAHLEDRYGNDARVRVLRQDNAGTAAARNRALAEVTTPYVGFLDSDDTWLPAFVASQVEVIEREGADVVLCDVRYAGAQRPAESLLTDPWFQTPSDIQAMLRGAWSNTTGMLYRTAVVKPLGYDTSYAYGEDRELLLRFFAAGHTLAMNTEQLAVWRHHDAGQKHDAAPLHRPAANLRMLEAYAHHADDPTAIARRIYAEHRRLAKAHMAAGHWHAARPHLRAWRRARPWRLGLRLRALRSLLARPRR